MSDAANSTLGQSDSQEAQNQNQVVMELLQMLRNPATSDQQILNFLRINPTLVLRLINHRQEFQKLRQERVSSLVATAAVVAGMGGAGGTGGHHQAGGVQPELQVLQQLLDQLQNLVLQDQDAAGQAPSQ